MLNTSVEAETSFDTLQVRFLPGKAAATRKRVLRGRG